MDGTDLPRLARDQTWFLVIFLGKVGLGLAVFAVKPWLAVLFVAAYAAYFWREMRPTGEHASAEGLEPLELQPRRARPATWAVLVQTAATLVLIFGASQPFVRQLESAGPALGLSAVVVALLLSPIATELPEIMNAIIWVRQGKTQLALANISGAMMMPATVPSAIGIAFTPWLFDAPLKLAGLATLASVSYLLGLIRAGRVHPRAPAGRRRLLPGLRRRARGRPLALTYDPDRRRFVGAVRTYCSEWSGWSGWSGRSWSAWSAWNSASSSSRRTWTSAAE